MASGTPPFSEFSNNLATLFHVATSNKPPDLPPTLSSFAKELLVNCMVIDPAGRTSAKDLLAFQWFDGLEDGPIDLQPLTPRSSR